MDALLQHKDMLVTTDQVYHEYLRDRVKVVTRFKNSFSDAIKTETSSFARSLPEYERYGKAFKQLKNHQRKVLKKIDQIISDPDQDSIYKGFTELWQLGRRSLPVTDDLVDLAQRRKLLGNPPGNEERKKTIGDQVNWEILLQGVDSNLILVSKDRTYKENQEYLGREFKSIGNHDFAVFDRVSEAFSHLSIEMGERARDAEESAEQAMPELEIAWLALIMDALTDLGGQGTFEQIYEACSKRLPGEVELDDEKKRIVRYAIYHYSSDTMPYLGEADHFRKINQDTFALRKIG